ncbi:MAG: threonylcarbamoyl-AMP synthase [Bacteroidales bacterium]|nr:threonylcarbamoyl-AMP synthase [Bacteroidales bacterium]
MIEEAVNILRDGGVILYPTDTIWGLGCDATNSKAVNKIYSIKQRDDSQSMLVLIDTQSRLPYYVRQVPDIAWQLIEASDRPLTLVYPGARNVAPELIAGDGSLGIRIVEDEFCSSLIARFRKPLVSTSANITGEVAPGNYGEISDKIRDLVDYIVPLRMEEKDKKTASSIIRIETDGRFKIIR